MSVGEACVKKSTLDILHQHDRKMVVSESVGGQSRCESVPHVFRCYVR